MRAITAGRILRSPNFEFDLLIKRQAPGTYALGVWQPGETTEETVIGGSVPYSLGGNTKIGESARFRDVTPEGSRLVEIRKFFLDVDIQPLRTISDQETDGDIIVFRNREYRVYIVDEYRNFATVFGIIEEPIP